MPPSRQKPIAKPSWSESRIKFQCTLGEIAKYMGWDTAKFHKFQVGLDTLAGPDEQDASKWARFVENCVEKFPALGTDFEDAWPIEVYYLKYVTKRLQNQASSVKMNIQKSTAVERLKSNKSKRRNVHKEKESQPSPKESVVRDHQAKEICRSSSENISQPVTSNSYTEPSPKHTAEHTATATCVLCGFRPTVAPIHEIALRAFFKGQADLRPGFDAAGVYADHYLHILLRLTTHRRERFMKSLASGGRMTPVQMILIADMLQDHVDRCKKLEEGDSKRTSGTKSRAGGEQPEISRPTKALLSLLCTLECSYTRIKERMQIGNDEYFDLGHVVEDTTPKYLEIAPLKSQNSTQKQALVRSLCKARPWIKRYEDLWPLEVLINRYLSARLAGLPGTLSASEAHHHECPLQRTYPANDVPPALGAVLADCGMEELGPAFVFLGVRSDECFARIAGSQKLKDDVLDEGNLERLCLTDFQRMMMHYVLAEV